MPGGSPFPYAGDSIFVDWGARIIYVPKGYMLVIQTVPSLILQLDTYQFHLDLRAAEATVDGMAYPQTHLNYAPVTVGGVTLARVIDIINNYTVTFEDDQYAVQLNGSNNNIADVTNVNQVSVRSSNSAGLTYSKEIEDLSYTDARVWVDTEKGQAAVTYPAGTPTYPVSDIGYARTIVSNRAFPHRYHLYGNMYIANSDNIADYDILGTQWANSVVYLGSGIGSPVGGSPVPTGPKSDTGTKVEDVTLTGVANGYIGVTEGRMMDVTNFWGDVDNAELKGTISLNQNSSTFNNCECSDMEGCVIDAAHSDTNASFHRFTGHMTIRNMSNPNAVIIVYLHAGHVILDSSCTAGFVRVTGFGHITDNSNGLTIDQAHLIEQAGGRAFGGM